MTEENVPVLIPPAAVKVMVNPETTMVWLLASLVVSVTVIPEPEATDATESPKVLFASEILAGAGSGLGEGLGEGVVSAAVVEVVAVVVLAVSVPSSMERFLLQPANAATEIVARHKLLNRKNDFRFEDRLIRLFFAPLLLSFSQAVFRFK